MPEEAMRHFLEIDFCSNMALLDSYFTSMCTTRGRGSIMLKSDVWGDYSEAKLQGADITDKKGEWRHLAPVKMFKI